MMKSELSQLRNLGPKSAAWLESVGIRSVEEIRRIGPVTAYQLVRLRYPQASLNLLWALAAGLQDRDWREVTPEEKQSLRKRIES